MSSTIGNILRLTTWGESHGAAIGGVLDGFPPQVRLDMGAINAELARRRTGLGATNSARKEADVVEILSGVLDGVTLGTPIAFIVRNVDARSKDYDALKDLYRPSHADYTYEAKYGIRDHRGGGRASARETVARVVAGAIAKQWLAERGVNVAAYAEQVGEIRLEEYVRTVEDLRRLPVLSERMETLLDDVKEKGDSVGGVVRCFIEGVPAGVGEPMYEKLSAKLASAMLSIPACKGFDYGSGFEGVEKRGSELNDEFVCCDGVVRVATNHSGGIQGGISNGEQICFRAVFKPIASIAKEQRTVSRVGEEVNLSIKGRHDVSVFPRVLPVVEAMAALVVMDMMLR